MGREAARNMVMIPSACSKASGFNNFKQYFQNDGGTVSAPELCFSQFGVGHLGQSAIGTALGSYG